MARSSNERVVEKLALTGVLWSFLSVGSGLAESVDLQKTPQSIKQVLVDSYAKRKALSIEYRFVSSAMGDVPAGKYVQRIVAADRRGFFFIDNGHGHESMTLAEDPFRKISSVSPHRTEIFMTLDRVLEGYSGRVPDEFLRALPREIVFLLGWWPFVGAPEQKILGRERSIDALERDDSYILQNQVHMIDGYECDVIEIPKADAIWVDTTSGGVIRRRELFDNESGALALRIEFGDFRMVSDDIRMPMSIKTSEFDYEAPFAVGRERCLNLVTYQILNCRLNEGIDVPAMAPVYSPGTIRRVRDGEYQLVTSEEVDHAGSMVAWGRKQIDSSGDQANQGSMSSLRSSLLFFGSGFAVGCLIWFLLLGFRK